MGCCFSSTKTSQHAPNDEEHRGVGLPGRPRVQEPVRVHVGRESRESRESRAPPPSDEETVKEVLSETPISKPQTAALEEEQSQTKLPVVQLHAEKMEVKGVVHKADEVSEVSQVSEICSITESFSTATTNTTVTEKRDDEAVSRRSRREVPQGRSNRSPAKVPGKRPYAADIASGRERRGKSPVRRVDPSPDKKRPQMGSRSIRERDSGPVAARRQNVGISAGTRRDTSDISSRRSRSPATRTAGGLGKDVPGRNKMQSAGRTGVQRAGEESVKKEVGPDPKKAEESNGTPDANESIDNPHVAMECFIFL